MAATPAFLPHIASMTGYLPGEQPRDSNTIKLNTNENPYPASPLVMARLRAASGIRQRLSALFDLPAEQFVVGNGSDELLNVAVRCFAGAGDAVAYATPSYPYYAKLIDLQAARAVKVEFDADYSLPVGLATTDGVMTIVPNPNSPSGTAVSSAALDDLAARLRGILVVDEAYVDFSIEGALDLVRRHDNVIVMRTLSKSFSLAGVRIGYLLARPELVRQLEAQVVNYRLGLLQQELVIAALGDEDHLPWLRQVCAEQRRVLCDGINALDGLEAFENSIANFVLCRTTDGGPAKDITDAVEAAGVHLKTFADIGRQAYREYFRITLGLAEENLFLLDLIQQANKARHA